MRTCLSCKHLRSELKPGCKVKLRYKCLKHMLLAGWLSKAAVITLGNFADCSSYQNKHTATAKLAYKQPECEVWL